MGAEMNYEEMVLDDRAKSYMRSYLQDGNTLSHRILATSRLSDGTVTTLLPSTITREDAHDFVHAGKFPESQRIRHPGSLRIPLVDIGFYPAERFERFLRARKNNLCVFEGMYAKPQDPFLSRVKSRVYTYGDEVYFVLLSQDARQPEIRQAIREAGWWRGITAIMTSIPEPVTPQWLEAKEWDSDQLTLLATRLEALVLGAYDAEGYLIWTLGS
jgi:hypothetical protein